ncbi:protein PRRC2C isoform X4 [Bacillus rossius redtenbacheri]|uniref:protein PRRC2C isoform X4 n=1 Tax=Bacillus rossius redtenbacheri TaxID=93214 RepID=UPI002FDD326A
MSTLSGNASKGEKGKSKFQSLDINSLYRGESLEPQQLKHTLLRKHGMQSLGKVPSARRPPANLPSLKSEHSGNDPAISLVPSGGTGWGSKPGEGTGQPATSSQPSQPAASAVQTPVSTAQAQQQPTQIAAPSSAPVVPAPPVQAAGPVVAPQTQSAAPPAPGQAGVTDKSWSSIMAGPGEALHPPSFLAHQSPQFQQEFPKLSSGDGQAPAAGPKGGSDSQYGPGPSLRPQTEGSWIQGGGRNAVLPAGNPPPAALVQGPGPLTPHLPPGSDPAGARNSLVQCAAPGVGMVPGGPVQNAMPPALAHMPHGGAAAQHQFRGLIPQFVYRGSFPGGFPPNFTGAMHGPRPRFPYQPDNNRFAGPPRTTPSTGEDEVVPRPIIKEEELIKMDDIAQDASWATHDDIDYNQKLAFSDDESPQDDKDARCPIEEKRPERETDSTDKDRDDPRKEVKRQDGIVPTPRALLDQRNWAQGRALGVDYRAPSQSHGPSPMSFPLPSVRAIPHQVHPNGPHVVEEDEIWHERRRQQSENMANVVERAKQRKEEEEKRFESSRERAKQRKEEQEKKYDESRQKAAEKLQELEQRMGWDSKPKEHSEEAPPPLPLPDWEKGRDKDKERERDRDRERSRTSSESRSEDKPREPQPREPQPREPQPREPQPREPQPREPQPREPQPREPQPREPQPRELQPREPPADFRQPLQVGEQPSSFLRGERDGHGERSERERDRDMRGERQGQDVVFSRQFQSNLPPRFQKQQAERHQHQFLQPFDPRWGGSSSHFHPTLSAGGLKLGRGGRRGLSDESVNAEQEKEHERESLDDRPPSRDKDKRERLTPDQHERDRERESLASRYRQGARDTRGGYDRKMSSSSGSYFEGGPEYGRSFSREYDRERVRERDQDGESRTDSGRQGWESRQYEDGKHDRHGKASVQQDPFDERETANDWRDSKDWKMGDENKKLERRDWERESRERESDRRERDFDRRDRERGEERPQRPDSCASRDSSRDDKLTSDDHKPLLSGSWAESAVEAHFMDLKEEKPKKFDYFRHSGMEERDRREIVGRHAPGPITREKLEAAELRGDTKRGLTQLKRSSSGPGLSLDKKQGDKDAQVDKLEGKLNDAKDVWNRSTSQKTADNVDPGHRAANSMENIGKIWNESQPADDIASSEGHLNLLISDQKKESEGTVVKDGAIEDKATGATVPKAESNDAELDTARTAEEKKASNKDTVENKMDKTTRRGSNRMESGRGSRQNWSSYAVYRGGYGPQRESRGRRGGHRAARGDRPPSNSHTRDWAHGSDSELSVDEVSASTESGKEDTGRSVSRRHERRPPRSPKQGNRRGDKDDRSREVRHSENEKTFPSPDSRRFEKRGGGYESNRGGREGFAPRGEPSRRGRGGFKPRGSVGRRMDGYGPPSSKSPFGQPSDENKVLGLSDKEAKDNHNVDNLRDISIQDDMGTGLMSSDDRMKLKQQQLAAGIIGGARHSKVSGMQVPPRMQRKSESERRDSSRSKNSRGRGRDRDHPAKQNSSDAGEECWETTSENSEADDRDGKADIRNGRKSFPRRDGQGSGRRSGFAVSPRPGRGNGGGGVGQCVTSSRAPGAEKRSNVYGGRNGPMLGGGPPNGRPLSRGGRQSPNKMGMKECATSVTRVDDIIRDPSLVSQAMVDAAKKIPRSDKEKVNSLDSIDVSSYSRPPVPMSGGGGVSKAPFERPRVNKLPPRLAKQRANDRLQKAAQQQQQHGGMHGDVSDVNAIPLFPMKDSPPVQVPSVNAWDKPISAALRPSSPNMSSAAGVHLASALGSSTDGCVMEVNDQPPSGASSQRSTPNGEKAAVKLARESMEKAVLDGTSPPVQTIIFENTNYKSSPADLAMKAKFGNHLKNQRIDKSRERKLSEDAEEVALGFSSKPPGTMGDISKSSDSKADQMQMPLGFNKVWESVPAMPTVIEHTEDGNVSTASSFTPSFGNPVDSGLDPSSFVKSVDGPGDDNSQEVVYSTGPSNSYVSSKADPTATSSNVCKVKPQQQAIMSGPSPIGHPGGAAGALSPPPFNSTGQQGHINYQATLGGTAAQFGGISAIPSPPTVLYNSTQPIQSGLYGAYQIDGTQVLSGQARSQFSQFPPYGLSQGLSQTSAFNQQSMYLQTAPHPPPSAVHDLSLSQFRLQAAQAPFGQSQQLSSNPNTVLISSSSNSLMSASVKPSSQQIGAIGTKGASPYQQSAPQPSQLYIQYDPGQVLNVNQSFLSSSQMVQRQGPVQSNVVPPIPPSSSFYSGSSGGQTGFFQPTNSTLQAVQQQAPTAQQMHQTGSPYSLQGYGNQSGAATPVGLQSFGSQFLSSPLQMAQQYRSSGLPGPTFLKSGGHNPSDHSITSNGRAQLKSPSGSQDVLSSVFSSAQIPSPKSRNPKQQPQQQSPTQQQPPPQAQHHKFNTYQGAAQSQQLGFQQSVRGQMNIGVRGVVPAQPSRYPAPIQRPVAYQGQGQGLASNSNAAAAAAAMRHRTSHPPPARPLGMGKGGQSYYGGNMKMDGNPDAKNEGIDAKMSNGGPAQGSNGAGSNGNKQSSGSSQQQSAAEVGKEDNSAPSVE